MVHVHEAAHEEGPLQHECSHQHVDADCAEPVTTQERHQEAEADKHHHMYILEH